MYRSAVPRFQSLTLRLQAADPALLDDPQFVAAALRELAHRAGLRALADVSHRFAPQGVSVAVLLAESHVAIHTWPEHADAYVTLTTCQPLPAARLAELADWTRQAFAAAQVTSAVQDL